MKTTIVLTYGEKINDWTLLEYCEKTKPGIHFKCRCKCGKEAIKSISSLKRGREKKCRACSSRDKKRPEGLKTLIDISGKRFGYWKVIERVENRFGKSYWLCECKCGKRKEISGSTVKNGYSIQCKSCSSRQNMIKHGYCSGGKIPEYFIWRAIKDRCLNPNCKGYKNYGARGITICEEWKNSFECFINSVGYKPFKGATIDRIDNEKGYFPDNVRWTTRLVQAANKRTQKYGICIKHWAKKMNICRHTVGRLLKKGYSLFEIECMKLPAYKEF